MSTYPTRSAAVAMALALAACSASPPRPPNLAELLSHPAERALADGLHDYGEGALPIAEAHFHAALGIGLLDARDSAAAHKYLAFIACAFGRIPDCDLEFRAAFGADPGFRLAASEEGHPIWGPVYQRVAAQLARPAGAVPR